MSFFQNMARPETWLRICCRLYVLPYSGNGYGSLARWMDYEGMENPYWFTMQPAITMRTEGTAAKNHGQGYGTNDTENELHSKIRPVERAGRMERATR